MIDMTPKSIVTKTAFRDETVNMRVPLEISAESMQNHNKPGSKVFGFIHLIKHTGDNAVHSVKKAVEQRVVFEKKGSEIFIDGKNTMTMSDMNQFEGHTGSAFHGIFVATGRAKTAVAAKGDEFKLTAMGAGIHGTAEGRVTTVDHLINIFHLRISGMKSIFNFLIIISKDSL